MATSLPTLTTAIYDGSPLATTIIQGGDNAGLYTSSPQIVTNPSFASGTEVYVAMAAWNTDGGTISSFMAAQAAGVPHGYVESTNSVALGTPGAPASLAGIGLTSFSLITMNIPVVTWTNPAPIIYGTALGSNQLDATANVPGSFAYDPTNGTVLGVGTNTLSVLFTPSDTNDYSSVSDAVNLVVLPPVLMAPSFSLQPVSQVISPGQAITFTAAATGYPPPAYQWQFNGSNISGATGASYTLSATSITNIGSYDVVIANSVDTNTSSVATLGFIDLNMLAAVYVTGPIGAQYQIQSTPALGPTNWTALTNVTITSQPYIYAKMRLCARHSVFLTRFSRKPNLRQPMKAFRSRSW